MCWLEVNDMNQVKIVLDSSADITALSDVDFSFAPLKIVTAEEEFVDNEKLDVADMTEKLAHYKGRSSTSCPNVRDWLKAFGDADTIFCITITSGLSGSYNSALSAKKLYEEGNPGRRVEVIDSLTAGPEITLMAEKLKTIFLEKGYEFFRQSPTNQQFIVLTNEQIAHLEKHVRFSFWERIDDRCAAVRFAVSWSSL